MRTNEAGKDALGLKERKWKVLFAVPCFPLSDNKNVVIPSVPDPSEARGGARGTSVSSARMGEFGSYHW